MTDKVDKASQTQNSRIANLKLAFNVFLRTMLAAVLNFIVYMSLALIVTGMSTKTIGERIYETADDGTRTVITENYYEDSSDISSASDNTTTAVTTTNVSAASTSPSAQTTAAPTLPQNQYKESLRTDVPAGASLALDILSQTLMLILLISMPYSKLWEQGDKDSNSVHFGRMQEDKLRGLKVGIMAAIPSLLTYALLILSKLGVFASGYLLIYRMLNVSFMPLITRFSGQGVTTTSALSWPSLAAIFLTLAVIPLISYVAYLLGYKHISITEKIIYVDPEKRRKKRRF